MTEAEALEVAGIWSGLVLTAFTIYISFTFAYLVAVFYVGARLTSIQAFFASALYAFAAASSVLAQIGYMQTQFRIMEAVPTLVDGIYLATAGDFWIPYMAIMEFAGILLGIYFMWNIRRQESS